MTRGESAKEGTHEVSHMLMLLAPLAALARARAVIASAQVLPMIWHTVVPNLCPDANVLDAAGNQLSKSNAAVPP